MAIRCIAETETSMATEFFVNETILCKMVRVEGCQFDNIMLMGNINLTVENKNLEVFMCTFDMECLIKTPTRFQSGKPNCIDLILTNEK